MLRDVKKNIVQDIAEYEENDSELAKLTIADLHEANDSVTWWQNRFNSEHEEVERLNSIIKEVREYINKIPTQPVIRIFKKELLEILDKVNNNE